MKKGPIYFSFKVFLRCSLEQDRNKLDVYTSVFELTLIVTDWSEGRIQTVSIPDRFGHGTEMNYVSALQDKINKKY